MQQDFSLELGKSGVPICAFSNIYTYKSPMANDSEGKKHALGGESSSISSLVLCL